MKRGDERDGAVGAGRGTKGETETLEGQRDGGIE